jgi:hypothetical protein
VDKAKRLNESAAQKYKASTRLYESKQKYDKSVIIKLAEKLQKALTESNDQALLEEIIREMHDHGVKDSFDVWRLPVTKKDFKNANGRSYPTQLWRNVRDKQQD